MTTSKNDGAKKAPAKKAAKKAASKTTAKKGAAEKAATKAKGEETFLSALSKVRGKAATRFRELFTGNFTEETANLALELVDKTGKVTEAAMEWLKQNRPTGNKTVDDKKAAEVPETPEGGKSQTYVTAGTAGSTASSKPVSTSSLYGKGRGEPV